jgi:hypothetical protein
MYSANATDAADIKVAVRKTKLYDSEDGASGINIAQSVD